MPNNHVVGHFVFASSSELGKYNAAVSLHSHSEKSKEGLGFVPRYAPRIPILSTFYRLEQNRYMTKNGRSFDFRRAYWLPPLPPEAVIKSERERIEGELQMQPLISISDHDQISIVDGYAPCVEWSIAIHGIPLHLGIYNLPLPNLTEIYEEVLAQKKPAGQSRIMEVLCWLNEYKELLIVLNHPFADIGSRRKPHVKKAVDHLLKKAQGLIHALEINGYRPWRENLNVASLADALGLGLMGGGDRHGCSPNAILSLSNSLTLSEYIEEVRYYRGGTVLIMPEYFGNLMARKLQSAVDFFRFCPDYCAPSRHWTDRVYFKAGEGVARPLSHYWRRVPLWVRSSTWFLQLLTTRWVWSTIRALFRSGELGGYSPNVFHSTKIDQYS